MEISICISDEDWGKLLDTAHLKEVELRTSAEKQNGLYRELLLLEAAEFSDLSYAIESQIKMRGSNVIN